MKLRVTENKSFPFLYFCYIYINIHTNLHKYIYIYLLYQGLSRKYGACEKAKRLNF